MSIVDLPVKVSKFTAWTLYGEHGGPLWTINPQGNRVLQTAISLLLLCAGICLTNILIRLYLLYAPRSVVPARRSSIDTVDEETPLRGQTHRKKENIVLQILTASLGVAFAVVGALFLPPEGPAVALSDAQTCGPYSLQADASNGDKVKDNLFQGEKERRAAGYMQDCYTTRLNSFPGYEGTLADPNRCNFFTHREIKYTAKGIGSGNDGQRCPFVDKNVCADAYGAVEFITEKVPITHLGLNSPRKTSMRRRTVCSPLSMNTDYVDNTTWPVKYWYGPTEDDNFTFIQDSDPFEWGVAVYGLTALTSTHYNAEDYWFPIDSLTPHSWGCAPDYAQTTILFIEAGKIYYTGRFNDPIFGLYQDEDPNFPGLYYNTDRRARPVACVDWHEIHDDYGNCFDLGYASDHQEVEHEMLRHALRHSTVMGSLQFRAGTALRAQERINDFLSQPLNDKHWAYEMQSLFETSLARIQYNLLDVSNGTGHEKGDSYTNDAKAWAHDKMCDWYKFNVPPGYRTIRCDTTSVAIGIFVLISILGIPCRRKHPDDHPSPRIASQSLQLWEYIHTGLNITSSPIMKHWFRKQQHYAFSANSITSNRRNSIGSTSLMPSQPAQAPTLNGSSVVPAVVSEEDQTSQMRLNSDQSPAPSTRSSSAASQNPNRVVEVPPQSGTTTAHPTNT